MWGMTSRLDLVTILGWNQRKPRAFSRSAGHSGRGRGAARIHYDWRRHLNDPDSYWVTISQASRILGMRPKLVRKLLDSHRLPYMTHASGVRLMRRHEIEGIASRSTHPVSPAMAGRF